MVPFAAIINYSSKRLLQHRCSKMITCECISKQPNWHGFYTKHMARDLLAGVCQQFCMELPAFTHVVVGSLGVLHECGNPEYADHGLTVGTWQQSRSSCGEIYSQILF